MKKVEEDSMKDGTAFAIIVFAIIVVCALFGAVQTVTVMGH